MCSIEKTPGVCNGEACIVGTRFTVWTVAVFARRGMSEEQIALAHPTITISDVQGALQYAYKYPHEIEEQIEHSGCCYEEVEEFEYL